MLTFRDGERGKRRGGALSRQQIPPALQSSLGEIFNSSVLMVHLSSRSPI